jgi:peptidoglycan/LPS O-acetylase OafA/YrhL
MPAKQFPDVSAAKGIQANHSRSLGLDCLRSVSISIVLFNHALIGFFFGPGRLQFQGFIADLSASTVLSIEWLFVLSGYLIGAMMIRSFESGRPWAQCARDFWLRRWFRTLPNYYLFILVNLWLVQLGWASGQFQASFLYFSQNLYQVEPTPHFFGESWSLALDEWFYLLMPLMLGLCGLASLKANKPRFMLVAGILIVSPAVMRVLHPMQGDFFQWDAEIRRITLYHLDATGWGVLAAVCNKWCRGWWRSHAGPKAFAGLGVMLLGVWLVTSLVAPADQALVPRQGASVASITLMGLGTFLCMPWLTQGFARAPRLEALTGRISMYSYSIYLCHFPLLFVFLHFFPVSGDSTSAYVAAVVACWLLAVVATSALIFHVFEGPVADLRERFTKRVDASPFA